MNPIRLIPVFLAILLAGCATTKLAAPADAPRYSLAAPQTQRFTRGIDVDVTFPAGPYAPAMRDSKGIYYSPTARIIMQGRALDNAYLFVGHDGSHSLWLEGAIRVEPLPSPLPLQKQP